MAQEAPVALYRRLDAPPLRTREGETMNSSTLSGGTHWLGSPVWRPGIRGHTSTSAESAGDVEQELAPERLATSMV
jgi:hypothetical protein